MSFQQKKRAMTPKGQMSGNGSGPAIMMMPPHIRATFMPDPPLKHLPAFTRHVLVSENYITDDDDDDDNNNNNNNNSKVKSTVPLSSGGVPPPSGISIIPTSFPKLKRGAGLNGVSTFLHHFEQTPPPPRKIDPTPQSLRDAKRKASKLANDAKLAPLIEIYREEQRTCAGEFTNGMNCYNTLFVGRLAYEVTERKLLREMEVYGPVKDIKLVTDTTTGRSRGYAFVEYEHEEDMKRAYRAADGMRLEGRAIVVDVERGHTVPNWLPRKFGGGLGGGSRAGGPSLLNKGGMVGRFDPMMNGSGGGGPMGQQHQQQPQPPPFGNNNAVMGGPPGPAPVMGGGGVGGPPMMYGRPPMGGRGGPSPPSYAGSGGRGGGYGDRGGGGYYGSGGGGPPPPSYGGYRDSRGPPPPASGPYGGGGGVGYKNGPPPLAWERGGSAGGGSARGYDGDRKRRRSRSRSPDNRRRR